MSYQCVKCGKEIISVNQEERAHNPAFLRRGIERMQDILEAKHLHKNMRRNPIDRCANICGALLEGEDISNE